MKCFAHIPLPAIILLILRGTEVGADQPQKQQQLRASSPGPPRLKHPLRVFVLVGQSNMVGHGAITQKDDAGNEKNATLEWLVGNVPEQYGMLKKQPKQGRSNNTSSVPSVSASKDEWTVRRDVLMACNHRDDLQPIMSTYGNLHASLCGGDGGQYQIGPELGFGWTVGDMLNNNAERRDKDKILLLKVAWGGKSLAVDFRPPSSGGDVGPYYQSMIHTVRATLANITGYFPSEKHRPVKLSGFAWHQGWNDGCDINMTAEYESNLANLIRDVRIDFGVPDLPVSIGASGMAGYEPGRRADIVTAQLAVADGDRYPEFDGNVASVDTRPYCRDPSPASPSDLGYHWNNNCESYWLVGKSMGLAMVELVLRSEGRRRQ
mmetsp:Transcript_22489/g.46679  ORF Transcript_22489/g.46679 Transcript_22489/m.46679 type:complete len:377 (+) Transcript_22489:474-1604(+)